MSGAAGAGAPLETHPMYRRLVALAEEGHARGRDPSAATPRDVALARLYAHAFRRHVIGAFHATREALGSVAVGGAAAPWVARARECLADLADRSMLAVERDERVLLATFRPYAVGVARVLAALDAAGRAAADPALATIRGRFVAQMEAITAGNGLSPTRDTAAPPQGSFRVPALGIGIVPLVYGDDHSWNLAWLDGPRSDVPFHRHRDGVEIHLGYSPLHGRTVLGDRAAVVTEGYAMPIPPGTRHGYVNVGPGMHHVPFVFGSLRRGGWGVFLDVEPDPADPETLGDVHPDARALDGTVLLEREIARTLSGAGAVRRTLVPAERTDRGGTGGIELSIERVVAGRPTTIHPERFRAVSVVAGTGRLVMAGEETALGPHDHVGLPAGIPAEFTAREGTLVLLDAEIRAAATGPLRGTSAG